MSEVQKSFVICKCGAMYMVWEGKYFFFLRNWFMKSSMSFDATWKFIKCIIKQYLFLLKKIESKIIKKLMNCFVPMPNLVEANSQQIPHKNSIYSWHKNESNATRLNFEELYKELQ